MLDRLVHSMVRDWKSYKTDSELQMMSQNAISMAMCLKYYEFRKQNVTNDNVTTRRPLYYTSEFFYNIQKTPIFEIFWILQCVATFTSASPFAAIDAFFAALVLHLCAQLNNRRQRIKNLPRRFFEKEESFSRMLSMIVIRHDYLYE